MRERGCPREDIIRHAGRVAHFAVVAGKAALFGCACALQIVSLVSYKAASGFLLLPPQGAPPTSPSTVIISNHDGTPSPRLHRKTRPAPAARRR